MRFSMWPNMQQPWSDVFEVARHADRTGWDGIWAADHFMGDDGGFGPPETPTLEATGVLGALSTSTERVQLGSLVFGMTYRHPAVLANWASTVDHTSNGRLVLGIGAGWQENEHAMYGIDLPPLKQRVDRFAEACEALTGLLRHERTDMKGTWFNLTDAINEPKPLQDRLPILIGAKGDRMLRIVARYADRWNMWGLPDAVAERSAALHRACEKIGRDPAEIERSAQALVMITDKTERGQQFIEAVAPRGAIAGGVDQVVDLVGGWRDVGVSEAIIPDWVLGRGARKLENMDAIVEALKGEFS